MQYPESEYQKYIRLLSWQLLIDSHARKMPIRITPIAELHKLQDSIDYSKSRWDNAKIVCSGILDRYNINYSPTACEQLAAKVLSPLCVLRMCVIRNPYDLIKLCDLPHTEATTRCSKVKSVYGKHPLCITDQETIILQRFDAFIKLHSL